MIDEVFRPWGLFPWVCDRLSTNEWSLLGCLSAEERCLGIAYNGIKKDVIQSTTFLEVIDPESYYAEISSEKRCMFRNELNRLFAGNERVVEIKLFEPTILLKSNIQKFISESNGNVIIDISSFPKRFFSPIIKDLINSDKVKNLMVTYTLPIDYYNGCLAEEPKPWDHLPRYQHTNDFPVPIVKNVVVGVGFLPFSLPELLEDNYSDAVVTLLFPFPPGPPNYQRTWEFVRVIERFRPLERDSQIIRVDVLDMPGCYQQICSIGRNGEEHTIFAPYGLKPHSLAMCLYAIKHDCDVFYTQPASYHPDYSLGMKYVNKLPETYAYCLKINDRCLF